MRLLCRSASALALAPMLLTAAIPAARAGLFLGAGEMVQAAGDTIQVLGGAAPSLADWNNDTLPDLIVGEGNSFSPGRVRVYLNIGAAGAPLFGDFFYATSFGDTLEIDSLG